MEEKDETYISIYEDYESKCKHKWLHICSKGEETSIYQCVKCKIIKCDY